MSTHTKAEITQAVAAVVAESGQHFTKLDMAMAYRAGARDVLAMLCRPANERPRDIIDSLPGVGIEAFAQALAGGADLGRGGGE